MIPTTEIRTKLPQLRFYAFNPLQPRGSDGKWTHSGEAAAHAGLRQEARKNKLYSIAARHHAQQLGHETANAIAGGHDAADHLARMGKAVTALRIQAYHARKKGDHETAAVRLAAANHYAGMRRGLKKHAKGKGDLPDMEAFGASHEAAAKAAHAQTVKDQQGHADLAGELEKSKADVRGLPTPAGKEGPKNAVGQLFGHLANVHRALSAGDVHGALDHLHKASVSANGIKSTVKEASTLKGAGKMIGQAASKALAEHAAAQNALKDTPEVAHQLEARKMADHAMTLPEGSPERAAALSARDTHQQLSNLHRAMRVGGSKDAGFYKTKHADIIKGMAHANADDATKASLGKASDSLRDLKAKIASRESAGSTKVRAGKISSGDLADWHNGQADLAAQTSGPDGKPDDTSKKLAAAHEALSDGHARFAAGEGGQKKQLSEAGNTADAVRRAVEAGMKGSPAQVKQAGLLNASHKMLKERMADLSAKPAEPKPAPKVDPKPTIGDTPPMAPKTQEGGSSAAPVAEPKKTDKPADALPDVDEAAGKKINDHRLPLSDPKNWTPQNLAVDNLGLAHMAGRNIIQSPGSKGNDAMHGYVKDMLGKTDRDKLPDELKPHYDALKALSDSHKPTEPAPTPAPEPQPEPKVEPKPAEPKTEPAPEPKPAKKAKPAAGPSMQDHADSALTIAQSTKGAAHKTASHLHDAFKALDAGDSEAAKGHIKLAQGQIGKVQTNHPLNPNLHNALKTAQDAVKGGSEPTPPAPTPEPQPKPAKAPAGAKASGVFNEDAHRAAAEQAKKANTGTVEDGNNALADFHAAMAKGDEKGAHAAYMNALPAATATANSWKGDDKTPAGKMLIKGAKHAAGMIGHLPGPRLVSAFDDIKASEKANSGDAKAGAALKSLASAHASMATSFLANKPGDKLSDAQAHLDKVNPDDLPDDMKHHYAGAQKLLADTKAMHAGTGPAPTPAPQPKPAKAPAKAKPGTDHAFLAASMHDDAKAFKAQPEGNNASSPSGIAEHVHRMVGDAHEHLDQATKALAKGDKEDAAAHLVRAQHQMSLVSSKSAKAQGSEFGAAHKLALKGITTVANGVGTTKPPSFTKDEMTRAKSTSDGHDSNARTLKDKGYITAGTATDHLSKSYESISKGDAKAAGLHAQNALDALNQGVTPVGAQPMHDAIAQKAKGVLQHLDKCAPEALPKKA